MMENFEGLNSSVNSFKKVDKSEQSVSGQEKKVKNFYSDSKNENVEDEIDRRSFSKRIAVVVGLALGVGKFGKFLDFKDENLATKEQLKIKGDDNWVIGKTIENQLEEGGKVTLNLETKEAIRQKWEKSYSKKPENCLDNDKESGKNHLGLLQSMEKMQPWILAMKAEFIKEGVPEEFAYLTIPESHFDLSAVSKAGAVGPFQFTKGTASLFGLLVNDKIDNRFDPIESASACAKHLKYSYEKFNNDWDLAFADYNGGFTNKYAKFRSKKEDRNYVDYLQWREDRINKFISQEHRHRVKSGQNLTKISKKYGVSLVNLMKVNNLKDDKIKVNQELKIPIKNSIIINKLSDSLENLNYPEKLYAVLDVIKKEDLKKRFPAKPIEFDLKEIPKNDTTEFSQVVQKGEGLFALARRFKSMARKKNNKFDLSIFQIQGLIEKQNGINKSKKIYPGQKFKLNLQLDRNYSLSQMAQKLKIDILELQKLNPAIFNFKKSLPFGIKIRVPKT